MSTKDTKHTPGPWAQGSKHGPTIYGGADGKDVVANVRITQTASMSLSEEGLANARLIAQAPAMLDSMRELLAVVSIQNGNLHADTNEIQDRARAILATIDGEG